MARTALSKAGLIVALALIAAPPFVADDRGGTIRFFVYMDSPKYPLKDVPLILVSKDGSETLGKTDQGGIVLARKADILEKRGLALLFCFENSSTACSALRLEDGSVLGVSSQEVVPGFVELGCVY